MKRKYLNLIYKGEASEGRTLIFQWLEEFDTSAFPYIFHVKSEKLGEK